MLTHASKSATNSNKAVDNSGMERGGLTAFGLSDNRPAPFNFPVTPVIQMFRPEGAGPYKLKNGDVVHYRGDSTEKNGKIEYKMYRTLSASMGKWISEDDIEGPVDGASSGIVPAKPKTVTIDRSVEAEPKKALEPKESKAGHSVSGQIDLDNTGLTFDQCKEVGNEAIAYARKKIPHAGNQEEEYENDLMVLASSELTKGLYIEFKEFVARYKGGEHRSLVATSIPPEIRRNIVSLTAGGTCGEYATLVYLFLREHNIPCKIFKSAGHGEHAWVMMRSNDGRNVCIDAWPTETREVVPIEQYFASVDQSKTSELHETIRFQEENEDIVDELWAEFLKEIIQAIRRVPETFKRNIDNYQFPRGTVRSTKIS